MRILALGAALAIAIVCATAPPAMARDAIGIIRYHEQDKAVVLVLTKPDQHQDLTIGAKYALPGPLADKSAGKKRSGDADLYDERPDPASDKPPFNLLL